MGSTAHSSKAAGDLTEVSIEPKKSEEIVRSDKREQRETFAYLKKALDEDHPSGRKLFHPRDRTA